MALPWCRLFRSSNTEAWRSFMSPRSIRSNISTSYTAAQNSTVRSDVTASLWTLQQGVFLLNYSSCLLFPFLIPYILCVWWSPLMCPMDHQMQRIKNLGSVMFVLARMWSLSSHEPSSVVLCWSKTSRRWEIFLLWTLLTIPGIYCSDVKKYLHCDVHSLLIQCNAIIIILPTLCTSLSMGPHSAWTNKVINTSDNCH